LACTFFFNDYRWLSFGIEFYRLFDFIFCYNRHRLRSSTSLEKERGFWLLEIFEIQRGKVLSVAQDSFPSFVFIADFGFQISRDKFSNNIFRRNDGSHGLGLFRRCFYF